jgi:hypothetical protein
MIARDELGPGNAPYRFIPLKMSARASCRRHIREIPTQPLAINVLARDRQSG